MTRTALLALSLAALAWLWRRDEGTWTASVSHYRGADDPEPEAAEPMDDIQWDPWTRAVRRGTQSGPVGPSA